MEKRKRPPLPLDASPQEKYDNLILTFYEDWQTFYGQNVDLNSVLTNLNFEFLGLKNKAELYFLINTIVENGHFQSPFKKINLIFEDDHDTYECPQYLRLSFQGINFCRTLQESGKNSNRCFVAMKFSPDMEPYYNEGIAKAIEENKFRPIRVDKEHTDNEQTINDFIIAGIKQSKFCIADLTHKSHGAYFEAGYALGRGLKVIYTCREDHFEEIHFDLKSMQIVRYSSPEELREALSLKIQAFILD
ncbi:MAG: hypothetical protein KA138_15830 [Saprospiraceae bacterium]|jgi:hypothetical protein|nr:hypothetical protein [Saprospiraceae bacterium]